LSIDYGTEWFKVALLKTGMPMDIVLNRDSKRKTASVVTVRGMERSFESHAVALSAKHPSSTFFALKTLVGLPKNSTQAERYVKELYPGTELYRSGYGAQFEDFDRDSGLAIRYTTQELLAMQFAHAKKLVEDTAKEEVVDTVISVPNYFTQAQRIAVKESAGLAGLRVISLVSDGRAAAMNYAMSKPVTETPETHMIYDMGAGDTTVTIATFRHVPETKAVPVPATRVAIKGTGYDETLGGLEIDRIVRDLLAADFTKRYGKKVSQPITESPRALARLLREANRVKMILSANTETQASIEGLHEDIDFRTKITRAELEEACGKAFFDRVLPPALQAMKAANVTADQLSSVILIGGGVRVPAVQNILTEYFSNDKIAKNLNGDEAVALGGVYLGASLSRKFVVKKVVVPDVTLYGLQLSTSKDAAGVPAFTYPVGSPVGIRKSIQVNSTEDFVVSAEHLIAPRGDEETKHILTASITGVADAIKRYATNSTIELLTPAPPVKIGFRYDSSGIVDVYSANATFTFMMTPPAPPVEPSASANETDAATESTPPPPPPKPVEYSETVKFNVTVEQSGPVQPLPPRGLEAIAGRLEEMDEADAAHHARAEALNTLESFIYHLRDLVDDHAIITLSTDEERANITESASNASDWLDENGHEATVDELRDQHKTLVEASNKVIQRHRNNIQYPLAAKELRAAVEVSKGLIGELRAKYTVEELEPVSSSLTSLESEAEGLISWLAKTEERHKAQDPKDEPVLLASDIEERRKGLERRTTSLRNRRIARKPRKTTSS
ncbi:HSP70-domain-containing protein, partial [Ramicandelaber brevisporus]